MVVSVIIVVYLYWKWSNSGTASDGRWLLGIIMSPILVVGIIFLLSFERDMFYKYTGREDNKKMNTPVATTYTSGPTYASAPQQASPLVVPDKNWTFEIPLARGVKFRV